MTAWWPLLAILAAWRTAALVCYESGPFEVFVRLRRGLARMRLHGLVACFHCTALWTSGAVVLVGSFAEMRLPLMVLAVAGGASLLERAIGGETVESEGGRYELRSLLWTDPTTPEGAEGGGRLAGEPAGDARHAPALSRGGPT
jgi:uncharacterized protein DUF1360